MSSTLRIKVEYTDSRKEDNSSLKFVYLIDSPTTTTIAKLITALQECIVTQFGGHNMQLVHLLTDDGYLLMKHYICAHVINNNEKLVCVDMDQFVAENRSTFNFEEAWLRLEKHDASDDTEKSLTVGINNDGKLYVYLFGGENMQALYLFNVSELLAITRDKRKEGDCLEMKIPLASPSEWFINAQWMHDVTSSNTIFLICSLKTGDTTDTRSEKLRINLHESTKTIEKGEVIPLSIHSKEDTTQIVVPAQARLDELKKTLSPPSRTGPTLDISISPVKISKYECEGESSIHMIQGNDSSVELEQESSTHDGKFRNFINITDLIISKKPVVLPEILMQKRSTPVEKSIAIAHVQVQYQTLSGKWLDCQDAKIAIASTQQGDRRKIMTKILNIEPDKLISISVHAAILVKGNPNRNTYTRSRAHRSLPQPLKLKIILTDNHSKTCSLIIEQMNDHLEFITKETFLKDKEDDVDEFIAFVYADDCEYDERIYTAVYVDKNHELAIGDNKKWACMDSRQISTDQFNAKKSGKTEELIEFINTPSKKATLLFDPETFLLYAVRIELTTTTSKTIETVLLPLNSIK